ELAHLRQLRERLSRLGEPLLVVPFVPEALGIALTGADWSWADAHGNFDLRGPGLVLRQRRAATAPRPARTTLPRGSGSFAVIRALIGFGGGEDEEAGATALAAQARVSQPRASQVLRHLQDQKLVERVGHGPGGVGGGWGRGVGAAGRRGGGARCGGGCPGRGGSERYFYTLDSPADAAV